MKERSQMHRHILMFTVLLVVTLWSTYRSEAQFPPAGWLERAQEAQRPVDSKAGAAEEKRHDAALRKFEKDGIDVATDDTIARRNCNDDAACEKKEEEKTKRRVMDILNARDRENARHAKALVDLRPTPPP
jgi:hypothetical protein